MTIEEITTRKECQTFDCKSIQIEPKALAVPIVAMANADGGVLAIGVSDKTRRIEGIDGNEKRINELLRVPFDFCNPSVKVKCEYLPCTDAEGHENRILLMHIPEKEFDRPSTVQDDDTVNVPVNDTIKLSQLTERQRNIYEIIKSDTVNGTVNGTVNVPVNVPINVPINTSGLATIFNVSEKTIKRDLYVLRDLNLIKYVGSNKTGHWEVIN